MNTDDLINDGRKKLLGAIKHLLVPPPQYHKKCKVIHDPIWGSCRFEPWEATLIDMPLFQRLRGLKQTGFAFLTYPAAEHSRFQHSLGVMTAASRIYDSIVHRFNEDGISARSAGDRENLKWITKNARKNKSMLRLAGLLHDLGHSLFSHTSERIITMLTPFPDLIRSLTKDGKPPGAAEVVVYLLVTSDEWHEIVSKMWNKYNTEDFSIKPPKLERNDWEDIGFWVMGQEQDSRRRFLSEIISGPLDADKLDYIARDAYFAGIPVGHDFERFISFVCLDFQADSLRLCLPLKGINALEQLIMARLALTSYLYHHQKVRSAESTFERLFALEFEENGKCFGRDSIWELFSVQDAELYSRSISESNSVYRKLLNRELPVCYMQFRERDLKDHEAESTQAGCRKLAGWANEGDWLDYKDLLQLEKSINDKLSLPHGSVIIDIPRAPSYADMDSLQLPGRASDDPMLAKEAIAYDKWIDAYKAYRAYNRIFAPRNISSDDVFDVTNKVLSDFGINLQEKNKIPGR